MTDRTRPCDQCGEDMILGPRQGKRRRHAGECQRQFMRAFTRRRYAEGYRPPSRRHATDHDKVCRQCGAPFTSRQPSARYCTDDCRHARKIDREAGRTAVKRGAVFVEHVDRLKVLERYGEGCHVCGDPVDLTAPRNHEDAYEVDHVVRCRDGGEHSYANVRPAHRRCNRKRDEAAFDGS